MKLQFLIPQYRETDDIVRPLLDSIAMQQGVDFADVGAIIVNDGSDVHLDNKMLASYPFKVEYHLNGHGGVSATRNKALELATADYVMFCDADDMFCHTCGLWIILRETATGCNAISSTFVEETRVGDAPTFINHTNDTTFVHGKVYRRQYLVDNGIKWNAALTIHEDSYFNILAQSLAGNIQYIHTPFYLWKWRDDSVCRHDPKYILKTYNNLIDSNEALVGEFTRRAMLDRAMFSTAALIFDAYYTMNKPEWINQENKEYRDATERRFAAYFCKHRKMWDDMPVGDKMQLSSGIRTRIVNEGMMMEAVTIDDWLNKIKTIWTGRQS